MKKLKLCNVHKLALSNEGEGRKPIHIPFGTWAYDDTIDQTLDREHAKKIAADLAGKIAAGEPGIPVYQGHPDVPEYASKYPDKGALGWIKRILVNENGMDLEVEWDRDPGKGFGWFSPFWTGDDPGTGATGKRNVIVDGLTSVGLVNNPNIREFRLANEAQPEERITMKPYQLPQRIIDLANEYDESKHPRAEDSKWTSGGGGGAGSDGGSSGSAGKTSGGESIKDKADKLKGPADQFIRFIAEGGSRKDTLDVVNRVLLSGRLRVKNGRRDEDRVEGLARRKAAHRLAIQSGFKFNRGTGKYE
ncbi:MAG: hypothetical protein SOW92_04180 [Kiritimatiellia bacterium]|nr:hypothetical protein [Kiritimatiellia bacterium]